MPIVVVTQNAPPEGREIMREVLDPVCELVFAADLEGAAREDALASADALIVQNMRVEIAAGEYARLTRLRFVQALTAGVDHLPFSALPDGVEVAGNPGVYAESMAEHVIAMVFAAGKRLFIEDRAVRDGDWNQFTPNRRMAGSVCGIIGFGGVGRAVATKLGALGLEIHAINRTGETDSELAFIGAPDDLERVLRAADIVVVAPPLTKRTRGMIGARELGWMKPDAILVNVSRGEIIDQTALYERLVACPDFTACIDAWWIEPVRHGEFRLEHPFLDLPNVIASPHNSASMAGGKLMPVRRGAENVRRFLAGETPRNIVPEDARLN